MRVMVVGNMSEKDMSEPWLRSEVNSDLAYENSKCE